MATVIQRAGFKMRGKSLAPLGAGAKGVQKGLDEHETRVRNLGRLKAGNIFLNLRRSEGKNRVPETAMVGQGVADNGEAVQPAAEITPLEAERLCNGAFVGMQKKPPTLQASQPGIFAVGGGRVFLRTAFSRGKGKCQ